MNEKLTAHNIPSKRSYIDILPHGRFRVSKLVPSWEMNACGSTKNVCVGGEYIASILKKDKK